MNNCFKWKTNDQYATPKNIYNYFMNNGYTDFNPLCENYENSLEKYFDCDLFCNPPYSNIEPFVDYMLKHASNGYKAVMLLPVRSGTKWFNKLFLSCYTCKISFFTQRLHFNESLGAPFDCMLVYLNPNFDYLQFEFIDRDLNFKGGIL